ncbi:hypothetical protein [Citrobacter freundii]|uniref:hypothetical protein n=1 Tax=Citrobacter freundii TaxID=546 RepID=UPI0038909C13
MRRTAGNVDIHRYLHFTLAVNAVAFSADEQRFALILPRMFSGDQYRIAQRIGSTV